MGINYTPRTWVPLEVPTAAQMNTEIRDLANGLQGVWTNWTPVLSQGATTNIGNTITTARSNRVGKTMDARVVLVATGAGTAGDPITVSLPATSITGSGVIGGGNYWDVSVNGYPAVVMLNSTTTLILRRSDTPNISSIGADPNIAVAAGDVVEFSIRYELA